jgi:hypothetical protein
MRASTRRAVLAAWVAALLVTHVVQWRAGQRPTLFGFLPWDLAYHLLWMVAAAAAIIFMTARSCKASHWPGSWLR